MSKQFYENGKKYTSVFYTGESVHIVRRSDNDKLYIAYMREYSNYLLRKKGFKDFQTAKSFAFNFKVKNGF